MERESFESERIAAMMNERFVCVKLDREERPEVDELYMAATVTMTGHGGWPMSVFLEPRTLKPFWCGTYFPAEPLAGMGSRPTFPQVLDAISRAWSEQRSAVEQQASELAAAVAAELAAERAPAELHLGHVANAVQVLLRLFDASEGGFGKSPKFPQPVFLDFLLDVRDLLDHETRGAVDHAVRFTLDRMMVGGLHDHVGGGFHRYCVDGTWTVPHFEKMLYDNAQLAIVYAKASVAQRDAQYRSTAVRTLGYVLREMTSPEGGFWSAQDAEVDGREGLNYLWTEPEFRASLAPDDASFVLRVYGVEAGPNFRDPHHPAEPARNVLRMSDRADRVAQAMGMATEEFERRRGAINATLYAVRGARRQPRRDEKVIAAWNGMMIQAMAFCGRVLNEPGLVDAGERAMTFVFAALGDGRGGVVRSWRGRPGTSAATLEDYAHVICACVELARAGRESWIAPAQRLLARARVATGAADGGFYDTAATRADLFAIPRSTHDGAMPSGSSVMIHAIMGLAEVGKNPGELGGAIDALRAVSGRVDSSPIGCINATRALVLLMRQGVEVRGVISRDAVEIADGGAEDGPRELPVEIYAGVDRVNAVIGEPAKVRLLVRIADGYHAIAADPGASAPPGLVPFRIHTVGGRGIDAFADYPEGTEDGSETSGRVRVYRGAFEFDVVIERSGPWTGRPLLAATYQACTSDACLEAITVELDVAIDPG